MESGDVQTWRWEGRGFNLRELHLLMYRAQFQKVGSEVPARTEVVPSTGRRERARARYGIVQVNIRTDYLRQDMLLKYLAQTRRRCPK
jgi:hypothetical protein